MEIFAANRELLIALLVKLGIIASLASLLTRSQTFRKTLFAEERETAEKLTLIRLEEAPDFVAAPPLSDQAVQQIVETSARRIIRLCTKRGLLDDTAADPLADEEPVLAVLTAASVRGLIATGARSGQRLRRVLKDPTTGCVRRPLLGFARLFAACGDADRGPGPAGTRTLVPLRGQAGPGLGAPAPPRFAAALLCA